MHVKLPVKSLAKLNPKKLTHRVKKLPCASLTGFLAGIALLVFGAYHLSAWYRARHIVKPVNTASVVQYSTDEPSEAPVEEDYKVAPDLPRQIILPGLQAKGFIQQVGIDQNNAIAVPENINLAGWYTNSPKPGDEGLSIIVGHIQGRYAPGIFKNLSSLKFEDTFSIEYGDGTIRHFRVLDIRSVPVEEASKKQYEKVENAPRQLTLITCNGKYDEARRTYSERTLVRAAFIE